MRTRKAHDGFCLEFIELHSYGQIPHYCFIVEGIEGKEDQYRVFALGCQGVIATSVLVVRLMVSEDQHKNLLDICNHIMIRLEG